MIANQTSSLNSVGLDSRILKGIHSKLRWQVLTKYVALDHSHWKIHLERTSAYILLIQSQEDFEENLLLLQNLPTWNPEAYFIILFIDTDNFLDNIVIYVMQKLWSLYVINCVILMPDDYDIHTFNIVTWFPYENGSCGDELFNYTVINHCVDGKMKYEENLFPVKIPNDMLACPIKVIAIIWPPFVLPVNDFEVEDDVDIPFTNGYEVLLLQVLEKYYNCRFVFRSFSVHENWGIVSDNGTCTGMYEYLYQRKADIAIGGNFPESSIHKYFDYSTHYLQDPQVFVLPLAGLAPGWINFYNILPPFVFLASTSALVIASVLFFLLAKHSNDYSLFKTMIGSILTLYSLALTNFMGKFPKYYALRMLLVFWFGLNVNLYAIFQIGLINTYTFPLQEYQISSEDEIVQSGLAVVGIDTTLFVFSHSNDSNSKYIVDHFKELPAKRSLEYIADFKNVTTFTSQLFLSYVSEDLLRKVYVSNEPVITFPIEMLYVKGFPFKTNFDRVISTCVAAGLFGKWKLQVHESNTVNETEILDDEIKIRITLSEISGAFVLLVIGYVIAIIVFIVEVSHSKRMKMQKLSRRFMRVNLRNFKHINTI
ncbi:uncharacterized protein LOC113388099 [Ctenocephalides felis]|uniref:uncharacterized protein LOC113388099 n=1 Tax=Ctenocephalides felis TaxID=7515 RepID=UPI000E6E3821|nr:uncharacterized protein LOC113388099 [Ctenocephalides felis]